MVGVVVVTHGRLGEELLVTAQGIVGELPAARAVAVSAEQSMEEARKALGQTIAELDQGQGVLVLTDMFGGTPANLALTFLDQHKVEVVTGVNLPMLLKLSTVRDSVSTVSDIAQLITGYGQKNIVFASELLGTRRESARR